MIKDYWKIICMVAREQYSNKHHKLYWQLLFWALVDAVQAVVFHYIGWEILADWAAVCLWICVVWAGVLLLQRWKRGQDNTD